MNIYATLAIKQQFVGNKIWTRTRHELQKEAVLSVFNQFDVPAREIRNITVIRRQELRNSSSKQKNKITQVWSYEGE